MQRWGQKWRWDGGGMRWGRMGWDVTEEKRDGTANGPPDSPTNGVVRTPRSPSMGRSGSPIHHQWAAPRAPPLPLIGCEGDKGGTSEPPKAVPHLTDSPDNQWGAKGGARVAEHRRRHFARRERRRAQVGAGPHREGRPGTDRGGAEVGDAGRGVGGRRGWGTGPRVRRRGSAERG